MVYQVLVRDLSGRTRCFQLDNGLITGDELASLCYPTTASLSGSFVVYSGRRVVSSESPLSAGTDGLFPSCHVCCRLLGGKGGFGSLLRGAATRAGQKKTTNFDACRDMSGRRLRHVNAERKLKEWKYEAGERKLEKLALDHIKNLAKEKKKSQEVSAVSGSLRDQSAATMERVAEAVKLGMRQSRQLSAGEAKRKRATWEGGEGEDRKGKKKLDVEVGGQLESVEESDEGEDEDEEDEDGEDEFDVDEEDVDEVDSDVDSENRRLDEAAGEGTSPKSSGAALPGQDSAEKSSLTCPVAPGPVNSSSPSGHVQGSLPELVKAGDVSTEGSLPVTSADSNVSPLEVHADKDRDGIQNHIPSCSEDDVSPSCLDWNKIRTSADLEVLGLEGLKVQLMKKGLKCGGTLQERASRLFLLKDTPLDKLDKKLLARPSTNH